MIFSRLIIYDVLSLNNPKFNDYIDVIYPKELEIKYTTDAPKWPNYLDLHIEYDEDGKLFTRLWQAWWLWFPYSPFSILIFKNPLHINIFCSEDLVWFQSMDILHGNRLLFGNSIVVIHTLFINLTPLCWRVCSPTVTYDWFPVIVANRDGCHMWGRKCSLFPEHLILLPLGSSWFHPFII